MSMRLAACPQPARFHPHPAAIGLLALALLLPALAGCYPVTGERAYCQLTRSDPGLPDERSKRVPMMRIGSLPHPYGPIPVRYGDPDSLGQHSYRRSAFRAVRLGEASGGIIYTTRIGFIDLAHTRNAADLTYLAYQRILPALEEARPRVLLAGAEPSLFLVHLDYPDDWHNLDADTRARFTQEIAVLLAVRMGYIISSWHEVLTSFGFRGVMVIPEVQSAFVYDDQPSHLLGAVAAGRAIRLMLADDPDAPGYDNAMTTALAQVLDEYGALDTPGTRRAVAAARGVWWEVENASTARQIHLGMLGEPFTPLLIHPDHPEVLGQPTEQASAPVPVSETPQSPSEAAESRAPTPNPLTPNSPPPPPWSWTVPDLRAAAGDDPALADALPGVRITIDPQVGFADELLAAAGLSDTPWLDLDRDGPALKAHLQTRLAE